MAKLLTNEEMTLFCDQISMILKAGITPHEGLMDLLEDTEGKEGKEIIEKMLKKCEEGASFYNAVKETEVFPKYALDMIRIGEKSGNLEEVMKSLSFHYRREENIKNGIKNAVTYPFIIVLMMLAVLTVLIVKVLPVFNKVFIQLGSHLSGLSDVMLKAGNWLGTYSAVFIAIVAILIIAYMIFTLTGPGKKIRAGIFSRLGFTRDIYDKIAAGRFAAGMSLSMYASLDMSEGLEMMEELVDNPEFAKKIAECKRMTDEGHTFAESLTESKIFPSKYARMVNVGYKTGSTEKVLEDIANIYEEEVDNKINSIIAVLEPSLVIILSIVVCMILLSVMLPLMSIMTNLG